MRIIILNIFLCFHQTMTLNQMKFFISPDAGLNGFVTFVMENTVAIFMRLSMVRNVLIVLSDFLFLVLTH